MTEKIFEVSTRFDGYEIEELQQYTEEELFEWGKDFADDCGGLQEELEENSLEELYDELKRFTNESFGDSLYRLWTEWNEFYDKNDDYDTEEAEKAQEIFDRGMLVGYEEVVKSVIEQKEDEIARGEEVRIVEYCGNNTFTEGWEQIYSIQPMQALGNSDFAEDEVDDFVEVVETELSENEALDLDGDIVREFGDRLRSMLEGQNAIGVLTIERKY